MVQTGQLTGSRERGAGQHLPCCLCGTTAEDDWPMRAVLGFGYAPYDNEPADEAAAYG